MCAHEHLLLIAFDFVFSFCFLSCLFRPRSFTAHHVYYNDRPANPVYYNDQPPQANHLQQLQQPPIQSQVASQQQNQHLHYQQAQQSQQLQEQQMLMMPPPYKSPPMGTQQPSTPTHPIMNSPTINRSPHYGLPTENGTTSEDSDGTQRKSLTPHMVNRLTHASIVVVVFPFGSQQAV